MSRRFLGARIDSASSIATRLATIALTEVEVLHCPTRQAEARGVQNLCQESMLCGALSQMMSAPARSCETRLRGQSSRVMHVKRSVARARVVPERDFLRSVSRCSCRDLPTGMPNTPSLDPAEERRRA